MMARRMLAHYEILEKLGEGGMGEVWRAKDTKLNRDVAIKFLPDSFAADADRLSRFSREAQVLASLNHPNIAAIYGVEERALVMELVEGMTLAERVAQGAVPLDEALPIMRQVADALDNAHEKGIVHRDLKPANIKMTPDARVKVLDFGLAKALVAETQAGDSVNSPTLTMRATMAGVILGTAAYMSPEQARGAPADKRSDVWSFGVVLFELLTGRQLFAGETVSDTLAAVLTTEPDWSALPADTPPGVRRLLRRCLVRDRKRRLRDIGDALADLDEAPPATMPEPAHGGRAVRHWPAIAMLCGTVAVAIAVVHFRERKPEAAEVRFEVAPPPRGAIDHAAISPDGKRLAFVADADGERRLYLRPLASTRAQALSGTETAAFPFWSPDGRFIAFFAGSKLKKLEIGSADGASSPQTVCELAVPTSTILGGSWNREGTILAGTGAAGIFRVAATGGEATRVAVAGATSSEWQAFPWFLPDGSHFLYFGRSQSESGVFVATLDGRERKRVVSGEQAAVYAPGANNPDEGHLLFIRDGMLMAQPFAARRIELQGDAFAAGQQVYLSRVTPYFSVSSNGVLAYRSGSPAASLWWWDRGGRPSTLAQLPGIVENFAVSRDGKQLALSRIVPPAAFNDIWLLDLEHGNATRLTDDPRNEAYPVWSPDGSKVIFGSNREGLGDLFIKDARGTAAEQLLLKDASMKRPTDWSDDGRFLLYEVVDPKRKTDLWVLPLEGERTPAPFATSPHDEQQAQFSPGSAGALRWVAYSSDETGRHEIYVQPFPKGSERFSVSTGGGTQPRWSADGKTLFFVGVDGKLMAAAVTLAPRFQHGIPRAVFETPIQTRGGLGFRWASMPDGVRFISIIPGGEPSASSLIVAVNWAAGRKP